MQVVVTNIATRRKLAKNRIAYFITTPSAQMSVHQSKCHDDGLNSVEGGDRGNGS
jgi:hypothetical protein